MNNRLISLDAFRGFTIAGMILVNNPGDWKYVYPQLLHAPWNGWTFTDWIFPFFLFIGGVSMTLSLGRRAESGAHKPQLLRQLAKRAAIIFLIGFLLNFLPQFNIATVRIPGVLQRIALCTICAAPIVVYFSWRQQVWWIVGLLILYTVLMLFVPVPDVNGIVVAGALEPGRDFGAYIDRALMTGHLWIASKSWDPEGLISTIPAICSQLFGVLTGRWLAQERPSVEKTVWMFVAGLTLLFIGACLDVTLMPINKSLWTVSYSIFLTGWALIMFGLFYWHLDAAPEKALRDRAAWLCKPFVIFGMNALFIFAFSSFIAKMFGYIKFTDSDAAVHSLKYYLYAPLQALPIGDANSSLLFAILFNLSMFAIAWFLWKKRWFIKV